MELNNERHITSRQPTMRAVSGGWRSPNLQTMEVKEKKQQVNPALRLPAGRWLPCLIKQLEIL